MPLNVANLKKSEIVKRSNYHCKHGHDGLAHDKCYNEEHGATERVGYFDIETFGMGFNADAGWILTYCLLSEEGILYSGFATPKELLSDIPDKRLIKDLCEDLKHFDRIITYYGKRFDAPYVRTRATKFGINFPYYKQLNHTDVYDIIKHKYSFRRRNLESACRFFGISAKGHRFGPELWRKAFQGDKSAMQSILAHNEEDVESLKALYSIVEKSVHLVDSSI